MNDTVERLRSVGVLSPPYRTAGEKLADCREAADEIERLRDFETGAKEAERLQAALPKIARYAGAGLCQMSPEGKHAFLKDISLACEVAGFDVLGDPVKSAPEPIISESCGNRDNEDSGGPGDE